MKTFLPKTSFLLFADAVKARFSSLTPPLPFCRTPPPQQKARRQEWGLGQLRPQFSSSSHVVSASNGQANFAADIPKVRGNTLVALVLINQYLRPCGLIAKHARYDHYDHDRFLPYGHLFGLS